MGFRSHVGVETISSNNKTLKSSQRKLVLLAHLRYEEKDKICVQKTWEVFKIMHFLILRFRNENEK
jgi:hypothetical protein